MTRCAIDGCGRPAKARNLCNAHYTRFERGDIEHPEGIVLTDCSKILRQCKYMMRKRPDGTWERRPNGGDTWELVTYSNGRKPPQ